MLTSKSFGFILMNLVLSISLVGCNLPTPQEKPENSSAGAVATFKAKADVKKSQAIETQVQGAFALPATKVFNLVACLKDVAYDKAIQGHDFEIVEKSTTSTSDKEGCITWSEDLNFNYLAESQYLLIERTIRGTKLHKGEQKVSFAINPWSHGETLPAVLNPEDGNEIPRLLNVPHDIDLALKGFSKDNTPISRPLLVDEGRFFITEQKITADRIIISVEVHPKVNLQLSKMNGDLFSRPLTAGTFRARLKLIHNYVTTKEVHRLMAQTEYISATMVNGNLSLKSDMALPALPTRGQFFLGLELEPVGAPQGMVGFNGLYYVSEYDNLKGSGFLKLSPLVSQKPGFTLDSYINATLAEIMNQPTPEYPVITDGKKGEEVVRILKNPNRPNDLEADIYQKPKVQIAKLEFDFLRVGQERTSSRQIFYTVKACFSHGLDQKTVRAQTFKVSKFRQSLSEKEETTQKTTDAKSCIVWDENITFDYFGCHRYLKGSVQISNADLGVNETIGVLVNPWETGGAALGRDLRYVDAKEKLPLNCQAEARPRTQIDFDGFNYNTTSYDYKIDSMLNMTMEKKIQLRMDGRMLVYSSLSNGWSDPQRLRDGVYLLRTAIIKNREYNDNNNVFLASAEKLVTVISGQIKTELTYQVQDLKVLGNRNNILVEIFPIDDSKVTVVTKENIVLKDPSQSLNSVIDKTSELETPTFVGTIILNKDDDTRLLRLLDSSVMSDLLIRGKGVNSSATSNIIEDIIKQGNAEKKALQEKIAARAQINVFQKENNVDPIELNLFQTDTPLVELTGDTKLDSRFTLSRKELKDIVTTGQISSSTAQKLCAFWAKDYWRMMYGTKGGVNYGLIDSFHMSCYHDVKKDPRSVFMLDRQIFIKSIAGHKYQGGENQGFTVGANFSLSQTHSTYLTRSWAWNTKIGLSKKWADVFSIGTDVGYTVSTATSDAHSESDGLSVNSMKSLTVQTNTYTVRVNKYKKCATVRLKPALFAKDTVSWWPKTNYGKFMNPQLTDDERTYAVTRGLMICEEKDRTEPLDITENYYFVNQETNSTGQQDGGDERNRKFLIALRSSNDFNSFIASLRARLKDAPLDEQTTVEAKAIDTLFKSRGASYPGLFRY